MRILLRILLLICSICSVYATSIGVIDYNSADIKQSLQILYDQELQLQENKNEQDFIIFFNNLQTFVDNINIEKDYIPIIETTHGIMLNPFLNSIVINYNDTPYLDVNYAYLYKHYDKYLTDPYKSYLKILVNSELPYSKHPLYIMNKHKIKKDLKFINSFKSKYPQFNSHKIQFILQLYKDKQNFMDIYINEDQ